MLFTGITFKLGLVDIDSYTTLLSIIKTGELPSSAGGPQYCLSLLDAIRPSFHDSHDLKKGPRIKGNKISASPSPHKGP